MSKNMKKLEKDSTQWRTKYEKNNAALLDLMSEKQVRDEHIKKTARQLFQLQKLCRTLQSERAVVLKTLKENNIECPPIPEITNEPEPDFMKTPTIPVFDSKSNKMETMQKNCNELKENLLQLQGQLNEITTKKQKNNKSEVSDSTLNGDDKKVETNLEETTNNLNDLNINNNNNETSEEKPADPIIAPVTVSSDSI